MSYLLDTNVVSEARKRQPSPVFARWWASVSSEQLYLSVLTLGEIRFGVEKLRRRGDAAQADVFAGWLSGLAQHFAARILPVDVRIATEWGSFSNTPQVDGLIAATAKLHGHTLVTRNLADFAGTGARLYNPFDG